MPRIRTIKPEFWDDAKLCSISRDARLTFIGLWTYSDDNGVVKGHPQWLKNKIFPYDDIKPVNFSEWLSELESINAILPFSNDNEKFYYIRKFSSHQVINRPNLSGVNPSPPSDILIDHGSITESSMIDHGVIPSGREGKGKERKGKERNGIHGPLTEGFDEFWSMYPKRVGKLEAQRAWSKLNGTRPSVKQIVAKLSELKSSQQWTVEGGKYIPNPATWLNRGGWDDECRPSTSEPDGPRGKILRAPDGD